MVQELNEIYRHFENCNVYMLEINIRICVTLLDDIQHNLKENTIKHLTDEEI